MANVVVVAWPEAEKAPRPEGQPSATAAVFGVGASMLGLIHQEAAVGSSAGRRVVHEFGDALERLAEN